MTRLAAWAAGSREAHAALPDWLRRIVLAAAMSMLLAGVASAHEVRPAYLSVREDAPNDFSVLFKTPMQGDARLALKALFSARTETVTPVVSRPTGDAMVQTWRMRTLEPLAGQTVLIDGLQNTMTDALVRVEFANGNTWTARLTPSMPSAVIPASQSAWAVFLTYVRHGVEHICLRLRSSAFRDGVDADRARLAQAGEGDHRVHGRAFDHVDLAPRSDG